VEGGLLLTLIFRFMETAHELLHLLLDKLSLVHLKIMGIPTRFFRIIILFYEALKRGNDEEI
jgi:hypothetical protein